MMKIQISLDALKQTKWHQYLVRFVFGGLVTAATGWVANHYGPVVGGLFLAIPSIFPASVTLVQVHKKEKEEQKGKSEEQSQESGEQAAGITAGGAALGAVGLIGFAIIIWLFSAKLSPWLVLFIALVVWALGGVFAWWIYHKLTKGDDPTKNAPG